MAKKNRIRGTKRGDALMGLKIETSSLAKAVMT